LGDLRGLRLEPAETFSPDPVAPSVVRIEEIPAEKLA